MQQTPFLHHSTWEQEGSLVCLPLHGGENLTDVVWGRAMGCA